MQYHAIDEKMLLEIFRISSPSSKENLMRDYIKNFLNSRNIQFTEDKLGNIFNLNVKDKPVLSCHTDTVEKYNDVPLVKFINIRTYKNKKFLKGYGVIGGDDKCGIYIILKLLELYGQSFNFIFSVQEETGCYGIQEVVKTQNFSNVTYGLVLDRRYDGDIICLQNDYGTKIFEDDLKEIGKEFGYKPAKGTVSDANHIKNKVSCANLSVGYYEPHSSKEYVSLEDLSKAFSFVEKTIKTLTKKYSAPEIKTYGNYRTDYSHYCYGCFKYDRKIVFSYSTNGKLCSDCFKKMIDELFDLDINDPEVKSLVLHLSKKISELDISKLSQNKPNVSIENEVEEEDLELNKNMHPSVTSTQESLAPYYDCYD